MKKRTGRLTAAGLAAAMVLTALVPAGASEAAAKPKLATKKITVEVKKSKTIGIKKKKNFKISFKSKNRKIATVNAKGKVTGKKKGTTKITVSYKKGKGAKKKLGTVTVKVTPAKTKDRSGSEANECGSSDAAGGSFRDTGAFPGAGSYESTSGDRCAVRDAGRAGYDPAA